MPEQRALQDLISELSPRTRRVLKQCFMTGKQCIFSAQIAADGHRAITPDNLSVFVIMPFRSNLEAFYRWSLRRFLNKDYHLPKKNIQRADEARGNGYIVCEKICRKIQESDLVLAEISTRNANVFYELGLAYGLERPVILMRDRNIINGLETDPYISQSLDLHTSNAAILKYPGIDLLDVDQTSYRLDKYIIHPRVCKTALRKLQFSILSMERPDSNNPIPNDDITFTVNEVLSSIVKSSLTEIRDELRELNDQDEVGTRLLEPWAKVIVGISDDAWRDFSTAKLLTVNGHQNFQDIAKQIEESFCVIIDVSGNDPVACFWLGYCHSRGVNVIPIYRQLSERDDWETQLVFDIRALWYVEYNEKNLSHEFQSGSSAE